MWIGSENGIYVYEQGKVQKVEAQSWKHWNPIVYALNKDDQQKHGWALWEQESMCWMPTTKN